MASLLAAEAVSLWLVKHTNVTEIELAATTGIAENDSRFRIDNPPPQDTSLTAYVAHILYRNDSLNTPENYTQEKLKGDPYSRKTPPTHLPSGKYAGRLFIPLRHREGRLLGMIIADNKMSGGRPGEFSKDDLQHTEVIRKLILLIVLQDVSEQHKSTERLRRGIEHLAVSGLYRAAAHESSRPLVEVKDAVYSMEVTLKDLKSFVSEAAWDRIMRVRADLLTVDRSCDIAGKMVDKLREISRTGEVTELKPVSFEVVYSEARDRVWAGVRMRLDDYRKEKGLPVEDDPKFSVLPQGEEHWVNADEDALNVALSVILENSYLHGAGFAQNKLIQVSARAEKAGFVTRHPTLLFPDGAVVIEIKDHGSGCSENILAHAREPYSAEFEPHGLGVGITIAKTLIEKLHGAFELENWRTKLRDPAGTLCRITLHQAKPPEQPPRHA
ncbi:MAG: ATP-binding protein [Verrucomicrobiia bacterium]